MKKDKETLIVAGSEIGLEANVEKNEYIVMFGDQYAIKMTHKY